MKDIVSIIVTTKNESKNIERLLKSVLNQTYKYIELILVDNKSDDKTKTIAYKYTKKVFDHGPERSAQRNYGVKRSKGKYLLFLDADMELSIDVIKDGLALFSKNSKIGAITIKEESIASSYWEKVKAFERSFYNLKGDEITDAARLFRRNVFEKIGGYDETITGPEDWDITENVKRMGFKIGHIDKLIFHYERVPNPFKVAQKKYYYGLKSYRFMEKHNVPRISPKTIYFLRPAFYRNWRRLLSFPLLSLGMLVMLSFEMMGGGLGYMVGKNKKM